ncbi:MAG TPA: DUF134 domain-containing protein [bacterium]|nr:DUF134 domain-containing protein [bacterium]
MARPVICRRVCWRGNSDYFKPRGVPLRFLEEVALGVDELEAIRLADLEGMYQEDAARRMRVSRQTFGNIIASAHRKVADALANAKALRIEGGVVTMTERQFVCSDCKNEWSVPYGTARPAECPKCKSTNVHRAPQDRGWARGRGHYGRGLCGRRS